MFQRGILQKGLVGAFVLGGSLYAASGVPTSAETNPVSTAATNVLSQRFINARAQLESQLAARVTQLGRLTGDVTSSKTLTTSDAATLRLRIATASSNMNALVAKVPTDTTYRELRIDRNSMLRQNRVYAVLTPQVFETIQADAIEAQVTPFQATESSLQSEVNGLVGQPGYKTALNHYLAFVKSVNSASSDSNHVDTVVLAQTPADYPRDTNLFVRANHQLLDADIALAHASYDVTVIGLASGGYTGS